MKFTVLLCSVLISSTSFAFTLNNGIKVENLPTASKSYSKSAQSNSEVSTLSEAMKRECLSDKAKAEAFVQNSGSKLISSEGCQVRVIPAVLVDQGYDQPAQVHTSFEVVFK